MRRLLLFIAVFIVVGVAANWLSYLQLLGRRETYHALEALGAITPTTNVWGQILGRNIPRHPEWMTILVRGIGTVGVIPLLVPLLALRAFSAAPRHALLSPPGRRLAVKGVAVAWIAFALFIAFLEPAALRIGRDAALEVGKFAGCGYFLSRSLLMGPDGPFLSGRWASPCNHLWKQGPNVAMHLVAFAAALAAFQPSLCRIARSAPKGVCPSCGYDLAGLKTSTCPECSVTLPTPPGE